jgi:NADPH2:quinone reductase
MYRAIRVAAAGPPSALEIVQQPLRALQSKEVLIRVKAIGINPVETYIRSGKYASALFPHTPGHDAAGTIEAVGSDVTSLAPGQRVYTLRTLTGAYAEMVIADARYALPVPDAISFTEAAAVPTPYHTAYRALFQRLRIVPGKYLLVHGATGGVGIACAQIAASHGLTVIGSAGSEDGEHLAARWCHHVVRHGQINSKEQVLAATSDHGPDYIVDMLGNANFQLDLELIAQNGAICIVGSRGDTPAISPRVIMTKECTVTGIMLWHNTEEDVLEQAAFIHAGLGAGTLKPVLGKVFYGLGSAPEAHEDVIEHKGGAHGKIVISLERGDE